MNTHIQDLAKQAKAKVPEGIFGVDRWIEEYNKQFAALLIEDSMRILRNNGYDDAAECLSDVYFGMKDNV